MHNTQHTHNTQITQHTHNTHTHIYVQTQPYACVCLCAYMCVCLCSYMGPSLCVYVWLYCKFAITNKSQHATSQHVTYHLLFELSISLERLLTVETQLGSIHVRHTQTRNIKTKQKNNLTHTSQNTTKHGNKMLSLSLLF